MLNIRQEYQAASTSATAANDNLGAAVAYELWELAEPLLACVDFSEDHSRYQASAFRFTNKQREFFAALNYLTEVEFHGHAGYFGSAASFGYDEALACFKRLGADHVVAIMQEAYAIYASANAYAAGSTVVALNGDTAACDTKLEHANPIQLLERFARRYSPTFERW